MGSRWVSGNRRGAIRSVFPFFLRRGYFMVRNLALSFAILLTAQAAPAFAQVTSVTVAGQLVGGNNVSAVCTVSNTGQFSGSGVLSGVNPSNGYAFSYPFTITKGTTASGKLVLTGNFAFPGGYPVTLSASVPNGPLVFSYVVAGKTYATAGTGTVTAK
jgi:hypothetical protein